MVMVTDWKDFRNRLLPLTWQWKTETPKRKIMFFIQIRVFIINLLHELRVLKISEGPLQNSFKFITFYCICDKNKSFLQPVSTFDWMKKYIYAQHFGYFSWLTIFQKINTFLTPLLPCWPSLQPKYSPQGKFIDVLCINFNLKWMVYHFISSIEKEKHCQIYMVKMCSVKLQFKSVFQITKLTKLLQLRGWV